MTREQYQAMLLASGGATRLSNKRGDRPQQLSEQDEAALTTAWRKTRRQASVQSKKSKEAQSA